MSVDVETIGRQRVLFAPCETLVSHLFAAVTSRMPTMG